MSKKVLIVDDEQEIRSLLNLIFEEMGFEPTLCSNGKEAFDILEKQDFDLLFTDNQMPVMSGEDLLREIEGTKNPEMKIILATGKSLSLIQLVEENDLYLSVDYLLNKPYSPTKIGDALEELFGTSRGA
ncbi:response regulator [Bacteriovorax sp. Seq25_V]|uniref:response regulator n=1 Tax=Bacteriovorax sp. Seq25_V TaxID=1201288 RepID=UPI00038A1642|nr:response regulator [Bacteriovorax sp. Seq25_V]EQC44869.1 response regulator receiver domain protein [Bacteriovorax sp. Seq25_V]